MTTSEERKQKVLASLRHHANPLVRFNHRSRLPIILSSKDKSIEQIWTDNVIIERDFGIERPKILTNDLGKIDKNPSEDDIIVLLEKMWSQMQLWQRKIFVVDKFHYDDRWFPYKFSVDEPQYTFGILKVHDMPYNSFEGKRNNKSFVCSIYDLIYNEYCEPFMVFVDGKFVNWNYIDVVFDCDDTYLLLHGEEYNYYNLMAASDNIFIAIMPFKINFIGSESMSHFDMMYDMTKRYIQDSLTVVDGKLKITVPSVDEVYEHRKMVYNVGAWLYTQLRYHKYGLLSTEKINKLKNIEIIKVDKDLSDNVISTLVTKFNALDKDSYDKAFYDKIPYGNPDVYRANAIFNFDDNGLYAYNGSNIIALLDNNITYEYDADTDETSVVHPGEHTTLVDHYTSNNSYIKLSYYSNKFNHLLFRENYMIFKGGLFYGDLDIDESIFNTIGFNNSNNSRCDVMIFYHKPIEHLISHVDHFSHEAIVKFVQESLPNPNEDYSNNWIIVASQAEIYNTIYGTSISASLPKGTEIICESTGVSGWYRITGVVQYGYSDVIGKYISSISYSRMTQMVSKSLVIEERKEYFEKCLECLKIWYRDGWIYRDNWLYNGMKNVVPYDPLLLTDLYDSNVYSTVLTGDEVNKSLDKSYTYETRYGLKIPRHKYENHESYVLIFEDGVLLNEYSKMIAYSNFFFIPMDREFNKNSTIELLWFNKIDNNQIEFSITQNMIDHMPNLDSKWRNTIIFNQYINPEDLKIFVNYPDEIMVYKDLVPQSDNIAFNISYRDDNNDLYLIKDIVDNDLNKTDIESIYTAVSSRKFIYQRLYVDQKAYRIILDKRFKYCDNQKQYILFINGRRMDDDSFLITIPKYDRPFWGIYLYTAKYVNPTDRIELFYVPFEMVDVNFNKNYNLGKNGYIDIGKTILDAPLDPKLYIFFINGKKIPPTDIKSVDTHTVRLMKDTASTNDLLINPVYTDAVIDVKKYMKDYNGYSSYDTIIYKIKNNKNLGYTELNNLFNIFVTMSNTEANMTRPNVGRIAIINEIVRDFWVTSGYPYNEEPFIYDYQMDNYIIIDRNGNAIIPALDATQEINIRKNEMHLILFEHYPTCGYEPDNFYEIGSSIDTLIFHWEFSKSIYSDNHEYDLIRQTMTSNVYKDDRTTIEKSFDIPVDQRTWTFEYNTDNGYKANINNGELPSSIKTDIDFHFAADRGFQLLEKDYSIKFVNGIYYGNIDEDMLQHFAWCDRLIALEPNDGFIPWSTRQEAEDPIATAISADELNRVIRDIGYEVISTGSGIDHVGDIGFVNTLYETGESNGSKHPVVYEYKIPEDLNFNNGIEDHRILRNLNVSYQLSPELTLDDYIIGNNNYFVYACPKRLAYNGNKLLIEFLMPDPRSDEILAKNMEDEKATPIYTTGNWSILDHNLLEPLDEMRMIYIGEFNYTNNSGYTEPYCIWRSNGFFTRAFEDYGFHIKVRYIDDSIEYDDGLGHIIPTKDLEYYKTDGLSNNLITSRSISSLEAGSNVIADLESINRPNSVSAPTNTVIFIDDLKF